MAPDDTAPNDPASGDTGPKKIPAFPKRVREAFARDVQRLTRHCRSVSLATTFRGASQWPYVSLTAFAPDTDGAPIFLFSDLSDHTQNLKKDDRASVMFEKASNYTNPQRGARVTLMGRIAKTTAPRHARRFLARNPEAEMYQGFGDFNYYRFETERVHYIGGFGKATWLKAKDITVDPQAATEIAGAEGEILEDLNTNHVAALDRIARERLKRRGSGWEAIGVDPLGLDLLCGGRLGRLDFDTPLADAAALRDALKELLNG